MPEPTQITVSTRSAKCKIGNGKLQIHLGKMISYLSQQVFNSFFEKNRDYLIQGLIADDLIIHYDDSFIKKYKRPYVKFNETLVNPYVQESCNELVERLVEKEKAILEKQGRQKEKRENDHFYNSCSVIVKGGRDMKCVNIKLFNNGNITLTGSKEGDDGLMACNVFLNELKKEPSIFIGMSEEDIGALEIMNYDVTMINSGFSLNFKVDLNVLLANVQRDYPAVFTKYNPDKYRGLIFGFFWNEKKGEMQNGMCQCEKACKGKGGITGECKKVTISVFKSGETIITGARTMEQIHKAHEFLMSLINRYFTDIMKMSIVDYIEQEEDQKMMERMEKFMMKENEKIEKMEKQKKMKKLKKKEQNMSVIETETETTSSNN